MKIKQYLQDINEYPTAWLGHGEFAIKLVQNIKPEVTVELGVDYGFSTFCLAYPQIGHVYGIDWFQGDPHTGYRNTYSLVSELYSKVQEKYDISNVELIQGDFNEVAKTWNKEIDLLHIDGFHTYEAVKNDYETWIKFCKKDAVILFHDVEEFPGVAQFFSELPGELKYIRTGSCGLGIFTLSEDKFKLIKNILNE
jgi:predicted O-methyltransferase YrrM